MNDQPFRSSLVLAASLVVAACGGGGGGGAPPPPSTYSVGGTVSGLASGAQLVLSDNGGNSTTISADGAFTFSTALKAAASYAVTVQTQPSGETCTVTDGSGTVSAADVTNVSVTCVATPYTVSGLVLGLASGTQVGLLDNGETLSVTANGVFAFTSGLASGAAYAVSIGTPASGQNCSISNGSGTIADASVSNVIVSCAPAAVSSSKVLLELGHIAGMYQIKMTSTRALSQDELSHWNLWNLTNDSMIANGYSGCISTQCETSAAPFGHVALAGSTYVIETETALEIGSAATGQVFATVPGPVDWWTLASDGSYVAIGNSTGVRAVSPTGAVLYSGTGNYSAGVAYALPGQLLIAGSSAGNVIQTITLATRSVSNGPAFQGLFSEWFVDGSHYQTTVGTTVYTYSNASVQEDITSLSSVSGLGGTGNWFWVDSLVLYRVGSSATPTATYDLDYSEGKYPLPLQVSGTTLAFDVGLEQLTILDLSGASPTVITPTVKFPDWVTLGAWGAASAAQWIVGSSQGTLFVGTNTGTDPSYLSLGAATGIAGSNNTAAIATAIGQVFLVNTQTGTVQNTIGGYSSNVQISADGSVLAILGEFPSQPEPVSALTIFSLPSASVVKSFSQDIDEISGYTLAPTGTLLAQTTGAGGSQQITDITGTNVLWSSTTETTPVLFSADATIFAAPIGDDYTEATTINIYTNYQLTAAATGVPLTWIANAELVTDQYTGSPGCDCFAYTATNILSPTGTTTASFAAIPKLPSAQQASATGFWSVGTNAIYSTATGATTWTGTPALPSYYAVGAVVGNEVVTVYGSQVLAEPITPN